MTTVQKPKIELPETQKNSNNQTHNMQISHQNMQISVEIIELLHLTLKFNSKKLREH